MSERTTDEFKKTMLENQRKKDKLAAERNSDNTSVLKSYRIKEPWTKDKPAKGKTVAGSDQASAGTHSPATPSATSSTKATNKATTNEGGKVISLFSARGANTARPTSQDSAGQSSDPSKHLKPSDGEKREDGESISVMTHHNAEAFLASKVAAPHSGEGRTGDNHKSLPRHWISSVALDHRGRIWAAFAEVHNFGGIARSDDFGKTWLYPRRENWRFLSNFSLQQDGRLYARWGEDTTKLSRSPLRFSANGGASWGNITLPPALEPGEMFCYAVSMGGVCFVGCAAGIYSSADSGATWRANLTNSELSGVGPIEMRFGPVRKGDSGALEQNLYVLTRRGVLVGQNGCHTWSLQTPSFTSHVTSMAVGPDNTIYVGTSGSGLYVISEKDSHWTSRSLINGLSSNFVQDVTLANLNGTVTIFLAHRGSAVGSGGISFAAISPSSGLPGQFERINKHNSGLPDDDVTSILVTPEGRIVAGTVSRGVVISNADKTHWESSMGERPLSHQPNSRI